MRSNWLKLSMTAALVAMMGLSACGKNEKKPPLDYMPDMYDSYAVKAQHIGPHGEGMRVPPEGTMPVNAPEPYRYANDAAGAGNNKNPLPRTKRVLLHGQKMYNNTCIVCHGARGEGDGPVVPKFPAPPTLHSEKVRNWADGNLYHVITMGQNLMGSYATQLSPKDRWAVVHYIRALQRSVNPTDADLKEISARKAAQ